VCHTTRVYGSPEVIKAFDNCVINLTTLLKTPFLFGGNTLSVTIN